MKIIGGKDYYDNAIAYGIDNSIMFVRTGTFSTDMEKDFPFFISDFLHKSNISFDRSMFGYRRQGFLEDNNKRVIMNTITVIFCGKLFVGTEVKITTMAHEIGSRIFYSIDGLENFLVNNGMDIDKVVENYYEFATRWQKKSKLTHEQKKELMFKRIDCFKHGENVPQDIYDYLIKNKISVFTYAPDARNAMGCYAVNINGWNLSDLNFGKVMPPIDAFQSLSNWNGTTLVDDISKMYQPSNSEKIAKHGFDEWSFRKKV